jgi:predicted dehydrogenase
VEKTINVGIIGCGYIFDQYIKGCRAFNILNVIACADIDVSRANARAQEYGIPFSGTPAELLANPDVQLVVNLTVPLAHAEVNLAVLNAGKHVYSEKPLAITRAEGQQILSTAEANGLLVGCAPDTILGGGIQTCRKLIDDGAIGTPIAATAFMMSHGPESWHPNVYFYYQVGGGPMFDMGPYYLSALVTLLGEVQRVSGSARMTFPERIATSAALNGKRIPVEIPTHVAGTYDFASGAVATMIMSFDIWSHTLPRIEIYGSEGTLRVPDPNIFGGQVFVQRAGEKTPEEIPLTHSDQVGRGIGVADMAYAIAYGRPHRVSGALGYHVLDVMHAIHDSSEQGRHITIESHVERPAALPVNLPEGELDTSVVSA